MCVKVKWEAAETTRCSTFSNRAKFLNAIGCGYSMIKLVCACHTRVLHRLQTRYALRRNESNVSGPDIYSPDNHVQEIQTTHFFFVGDHTSTIQNLMQKVQMND